MLPTFYTVASLGSGTLSTMARPRGEDWLEDETRGLRRAGVDVLVSLLTPAETAELGLRDEEIQCRAQEMLFYSLPITDYGVPASDRGVLALAETLRELLAEGKHVAVHCRQGIGRASLVVASVMVLLGHEPDDAFVRIAEARGRPVPDIEAQRAWVVDFALRRRGH